METTQEIINTLSDSLRFATGPESAAAQVQSVTAICSYMGGEHPHG